ncbi:hypothetical protein GQ600_15251 [Phytophthora cactorum]|nr:hypothetical protein GQ600_15251 [Phytophthora cactorum]
MTRIGSKGKFDFAQVLKEVVKALHEAYPDVRNRIDSMREAFLAVVGHRVVRSTTTFGKSSLDQVFSAGLMRLPVRGCILQCPYVQYSCTSLQRDRCLGIRFCAQKMRPMAFPTRFTTTSSLTTANHYPSKSSRPKRKKAVGDDDLFVLYCTGRVPDIPDALFHKCAVVDQSCWDEYFGPFAARFAFLANTPPLCRSI